MLGTAPPTATGLASVEPVLAPGDPAHIEATGAPTSASDRTLAWILTGSAAALVGTGVVLNLLARDALDGRNTAYQHYLAVSDPADATRYQAEAQDHEDTAGVEAITSYVLLGLGCATAGAAAWAWLDPPGDDGLTLRIGPAGIVIGGTW